MAKIMTDPKTKVPMATGEPKDPTVPAGVKYPTVPAKIVGDNRPKLREQIPTRPKNERGGPDNLGMRPSADYQSGDTADGNGGVGNGFLRAAGK